MDSVTRRPVTAAFAWKDNGALIEDVAHLGYITKDMRILDPTWGHGVFWRTWRPNTGNLYGSDLDAAKSPSGTSIDFTDRPWVDRYFDVCVFDPPYKLNGTPDEETDSRYGVHVPATWQERMDLIRAGVDECCRVADETVLVKCQDQVSSGKIRWQTILVTERATAHGFRLVDRFDMLGTGRPQPEGRRQVHAHGRPSTLLVFRRPRASRTAAAQVAHEQVRAAELRAA